MLREASIIVPAHLTGVCLEVRRRMVEYFGGVTVTTGEGYWKSPRGKVEHEIVNTYVSACENFKSKSNARVVNALKSIALHIMAYGRQECVYVRWPDGEVMILNREELGLLPLPQVTEAA